MMISSTSRKMTAFLSIILAFMNILPIPALDGGHVMFLLYEIIFRRKPGDKFMERAQIVGMTILIALLLWANGNGSDTETQSAMLQGLTAIMRF